MPSNILLINHYAGSPRHGMEFRPYYMAREWVRAGHRVTIAAASYSHVRQRAPEFSGPIGEQMLDGIRYVWLRTPAYRGNGFKRAANMFAFVAQLYRWQDRLIASERPEAVIASSTYPLDVFPAFRLARRCRAKLIFEVHDLWPLSPVELGNMSRRHPFIWAVQRAEDFAVRRADNVVSLLPNADEYLAGRGMRPGKFVHLPNGIDVAEWRRTPHPLPAQHRNELDRLRAGDRLVVGYAGALGIANALDSLLDAAAQLQSEPVAFVLVGQGPERERLERRVSNERLSNVCILPPLPKPAMPALLDAIDVAYIGLKRCSLFRFGISPNKLMDYMMAGKPVLQAIHAGNDLVAANRCGITVTPENPVELAAAVKQLLTMRRTDLQQMGNRGRTYVERHHDYRTLAQRFIQLIQTGAFDGSPSDAAFAHPIDAPLPIAGWKMSSQTAA